MIKKNMKYWAENTIYGEKSKYGAEILNMVKKNMKFCTEKNQMCKKF